MRMDPVDVDQLLAQDSVERKLGLPLRFGYPFEVNYTLENSGEWQDLPDGGRVWRLQIEVPEAYSTNLLYDEFYLPEGAQLFLFNADGSMRLGAFTSKNNKIHGKFATGLLKGPICNLEYFEPAEVRGQGIISISRVVHGYRNVFDREVRKNALDFGQSGPCNNNVNCPEGDDWQQEKRAVAMIITAGGTRWCTGALINNVRQDLTPYFLTADHCLGGEETWVFMFNYESPSCDDIDGPTWMTLSGSILLANSGYSDFALLELSVAPPDSYNVFYAGWNRADSASDSSVCIHHPRGDIKKISFDFNKLTESYYLQPAGNGDNHWRVGEWEDGTTEGGSSGSPLFDFNHHIIGQLHGGYAACGNTEPDWFGKFSLSWDNGTTPATRLKDWLDPDNTGAMTLNGREATGITIAHDPLPDMKDTLNDYQVDCIILGSAPLLEDSLLLYYDTGLGWQTDTLLPTGVDFEYRGYIPAQSPGTQVNYYIFAADSSLTVDSTEIFSFYVIDYDMVISPSARSRYAAVGDTIMLDFTITNNGISQDKYDLSLAGASWPATIMDASGVVLLSQTDYLDPDSSINFQVHVQIPSSNYMDQDSMALVATSVTKPQITDSASVIAFSGGTAVEIPFTDSFTTTALDSDKWVYNYNAVINGDGLEEASAPYSLNLDGDPTGGDTIISSAINLKGLESQTLSYYYQRTGGGDSPEANDDLKIEYQDAGGDWHNIGLHLGSGADMTKYEKTDLYLPDSAYHSAFRIRILNNATVGDYDDWFVDDIYLGAPPPYDLSADPYYQVEYRAETDTAEFVFSVTNEGTEADAFDLVDSLYEWPVTFFDQTGINQISSTSNLLPDSSQEIIARVAVPQGAGDYSQDSARVYIFSQMDPDKRVHILLNSVSLGEAMSIPWIETVPADSLGNDKWIFIDGAEASSEGLNPPNPPYSIHLNNGPDTLISRPIDLADKSELYLSFYFQRGGNLIAPDEDEDLIIEYRNSGGDWSGLTVISGTDSAMTEFEFMRLTLGAEAARRSFQLRMRTVGFGSAGDWFVDNIRLDQSPQVSVTPLDYQKTMLAGDSADTIFVVNNLSGGELIYNLDVAYNTPGFDQVGDKSGDFNLSLSEGGPDSFGYFFIDSDQPDGPLFAWLEISLLGDDITSQLADDNYAGPFMLAHDFMFYGQTYNQLYVGSNGLIGFSPDSLDIQDYVVLPNPMAPNNLLAWLWKDLDPQNANNPGAEVFMFSDSLMTVVQFDNYPAKMGASGDHVTAQVVLYADGRIEYRYKTIAGAFDYTNSAIGIENHDGSAGLSTAFNQDYLHDSLVVLYYRQPEWFLPEVIVDTLAAGTADTIECQFISTADMASGTYSGELLVTSNDLDSDSLTIPLLLELTSDPWFVCGDANNDEAVDVSDAVYIINYAFVQGSPAPDPLESGNVNCDETVDVSDAVYIINYAFSAGSPAPCDCE